MENYNKCSEISNFAKFNAQNRENKVPRNMAFDKIAKLSTRENTFGT
jgi:nucleoid DNA-binding protein